MKTIFTALLIIIALAGFSQPDTLFVKHEFKGGNEYKYYQVFVKKGGRQTRSTKPINYNGFLYEDQCIIHRQTVATEKQQIINSIKNLYAEYDQTADTATMEGFIRWIKIDK